MDHPTAENGWGPTGATEAGTRIGDQKKRGNPVYSMSQDPEIFHEQFDHFRNSNLTLV